MVNITKIEQLIKEKGWSKKHFCSLFNRSRTWIDDWKRGVGVPKDNVLQAIADKLETTVDYLTDKTEQKNKPAVINSRLAEDEKFLLEYFRKLSPQEKKSFAIQVQAIAESKD